MGSWILCQLGGATGTCGGEGIQPDVLNPHHVFSVTKLGMEEGKIAGVSRCQKWISLCPESPSFLLLPALWLLLQPHLFDQEACLPAG